MELCRTAIAGGLKPAVLMPAGKCLEDLRKLGLQCEEIPAFSLPKKDWFQLGRLFKYNTGIFFKKANFLRSADLVYINGLRLLPLGFLVALLLRKPVVLHKHIKSERFIKNFIGAFTRLANSKALIVPSRFIRDDFASSVKNADISKIYLLKNGLDERFAHIPYQDRFTDKPLKKVVMVGRIYPAKGHAAFMACAKAIPDMEFHVFGDSFDDQSYYNSLLASKPSNVTFHGWVQDIPKKIDELGIQACIVPSRVEEAFSLTTVQMARLSCIVLVRPSGALKNLAAEFGFPEFTSDAELVSCLEQLKKEPASQLAAMSRRFYECAGKEFGLQSFQARIKKLLADLQTD